jgi:hypothetical protein
MKEADSFLDEKYLVTVSAHRSDRRLSENGPDARWPRCPEPRPRWPGPRQLSDQLRWYHGSHKRAYRRFCRTYAIHPIGKGGYNA